MNYPSYPYRTPPSFLSNAPLSSPPQSSSVAPVFHYEQTVPAHRVPPKQRLTRHPHPDTHSTLNQNGTPTADQRTAVANLLGVPIPDILAWLEGFRSSPRGEQVFYSNHLSLQQYQAISTLSDCSPVVVQTWLNDARSPRTLNTSQNNYGDKDLSDGGVVSNTLTQLPSCFSDRPAHVRPRISSDQDSYDLTRKAFVGSQNSSAATSNSYKRWCFVCEVYRAFETHDGFKRHMREHVTAFYCIPQNSVRNTESGPMCAVCGFLDPDPSHLNKHNIPECVGKTYTRKRALIEHHAKIHRIHDSSALADQSKHTVDQKHFACGFCIFWCDSLNGLANHVDALHYRFLEDIREWDDKKVIWGILSQPGINGYWQGVLAATPHLREWCLTWKPTDAKDLRHKLEMSQNPATTLVQAFIHKSDYCTSQHGHIEPVHVTGSTDEGMDTSHSVPTFQCEDGFSPLASTPEQDFLYYDPSVTAPTLQSQRLVPGWNGSNNSGWHQNNQDRPSPQIAPDGIPASTICPPADHSARPHPSQKGAESSVQHQRPAYVPSNTSASYASQARERQPRALDYSTPSWYSPGVSPDVAAHPGARQLIETHPHQAEACTSLVSPTPTNQSALSPLSPKREILPPSHLNRAYSSYYPTVAAHRQETRDRLGMDTVLKTDNQQPFMQDQNCSQYRGRCP